MLTFALVDDIFDDGLDAGINLTWLLITSPDVRAGIAAESNLDQLRSPGQPICAAPSSLDRSKNQMPYPSRAVLSDAGFGDGVIQGVPAETHPRSSENRLNTKRHHPRPSQG